MGFENTRQQKSAWDFQSRELLLLRPFPLSLPQPSTWKRKDITDQPRLTQKTGKGIGSTREGRDQLSFCLYTTNKMVRVQEVWYLCQHLKVAPIFFLEHVGLPAILQHSGQLFRTIHSQHLDYIQLSSTNNCFVTRKKSFNPSRDENYTIYFGKKTPKMQGECYHWHSIQGVTPATAIKIVFQKNQCTQKSAGTIYSTNRS